MKEALDFCIPMSDVGNDFVDRLKTMRKNNNEIVGLEKELFKWAFECKLIKLHTFNMFNTYTMYNMQKYCYKLNNLFKCIFF